MRKLTTEEYLKECESFWERYTEYLDNLKEINREEKGIPAKEYTKGNEKYYNKQRNKLKKEYEGYNDIYHTDFYCYMNLSNIDKLIGFGDNYKSFRKDLAMVGKKVQSNVTPDKTYGILKGIAVRIDDVYFVVEDESTKEESWISAVCGVSLFDKKSHRSYTIVENGKDYL